MANRPLDGGMATVWRRLRSHKVAQWTLAYAAVAYTLLHVVDMVSGALDWPHVVLRITTLLLLLGLPVAATVAWYHGHKAQHRVSGPEILVLAALLAVGGTVIWWWGYRSTARPAPAAVVPSGTAGPSVLAATKSIAVLPFVNMSSDPEQEYFSDGVSEQILDVLASVPNLRVIARSSSFAFKGKSADVATIAARLNVAYVLEGSVRRSGERVRVTTQLIRASDSSHVWSETFDRQVGDIFAIQDEIALAVARELQLKLMDAGVHSRGTTANTEAYALFLQARYLLDQRGLASMQQAYDRVRRAVGLDPGYADAWALLGSIQFTRADYGVTDPAAGFAEARAAAQRALGIDPENVEGMLIAAQLAGSHDWQWPQANWYLRRAMRIGPGNARVLSIAGSNALYQGHLDEALRLYQQSLLVDPIRPAVHRTIAVALLAAGRPKDAEQALRVALGLNPEQISGMYWLGRAQLAQGQVEAALESMQKEKTPIYRNTGLALACHALNRRQESDAALRALIGTTGQGSVAYQVAEVHAYRGELDEAFRWLDRAFDASDPGIKFVKADVRMAGIRKDPRYQELLKRMNLSD
jgi:TolB-like protein/cytochrome c-type biogenesis protein CcmH/NrfG